MIDSYNNLIENFSELNKSIKQKEILNEIQETLMLFHSLSKQKDENDRILVHEKMELLNKDNMIESEFLDGLYAYIISMKESIGKYFELYSYCYKLKKTNV